MPSFDYLIIGGGIAGTTAAETVRQKDKLGSIGLVSSEPYFLYSRVLLPEFIRGEVGIEKVMLRGAEDYRKNGIEIFLGEEVKSVNLSNKSASLFSGRTLNFKKLLIASGGRPKPWSFDTLPSEKVFRLQTLDDALRIKKFLSEREAGHALVVGGGFMALEFIEILKHYGWKITLLCKEKSFWSDYLDENGFGILSGTWAKNGIGAVFGDEFSKSEEKFEADFIGVGIGLERNLDFLPHLAVRPPSEGIEVNACLETGTPSVWAVGDVAVYPDFFSGRKRTSGNWSGAFMQGRIAGINMLGGKEPFKTVSAYAIGHLGLSVAFVGDVGPFDSAQGKPFDEKSAVKSEVVRFDKEKNEYARIFSKNNRVVGAALINGQRFMGRISQAIMNRWDVSKVTSG